MLNKIKEFILRFLARIFGKTYTIGIDFSVEADKKPVIGIGKMFFGIMYLFLKASFFQSDCGVAGYFPARMLFSGKFWHRQRYQLPIC